MSRSLASQSPSRRSRRRWRFVLPALALAGVASLLINGCGERSPYYDGGDVDLDCRENPADCEGDIGGACNTDDDCFDGDCCQDKNCDGGMCTYRCNGDADCPNGMACEHDYCFFECNDDDQCGPGQKCEHGKTICEYEGGK